MSINNKLSYLAEKEFDLGNYKQAISICYEEPFAKTIDAKIKLAKIYFIIKKYNRAIDNTLNAISQDRNYNESYLLLAKIYFEKKYYNKCIDNLEHYIAKNLFDANCAILYIDALLKLNEFEKITEKLVLYENKFKNKAISFQVREIEYFALTSKSFWQKVQDIYRDHELLDTVDILKIAELFFEKKNYTDAEIWYKIFLKQSIKTKYALTPYGTVLLRKKDITQALRFFYKSFENMPENTNTLFCFAKCAIKQNLSEVPKNIIMIAKLLSWHNLDACLAYAIFLYKIGMTKKSEEYLLYYFTNNGHKIESYILLIKLPENKISSLQKSVFFVDGYSKLSKSKRFLEIYDEFVKSKIPVKHTNNWDLNYLKTKELLLQNNKNEAITEFRKALRDGYKPDKASPVFRLFEDSKQFLLPSNFA